MIKTELKKVFRTKLLYVSIFIGSISCLLGLISYGDDVSIYRQLGRDELISAYQCWLSCLAMGSSVYRLILPILIIPYIDSYYVERNCGYQNFIITRSGHNKYLLSKWFAGVLSVAVIIGAILSITLMACCIIYPCNKPLEENTYINYTGLRYFFIEEPIRCILTFITLNIITAMVYYTFGLGMTCYAKNRYSVIFSPMAAYFACLFAAQILNIPEISPIATVAPFELSGLNLSSVLTAAGVELMVSLLMLINCFRKDLTEIV